MDHTALKFSDSQAYEGHFFYFFLIMLYIAYDISIR